jgi:hypothetical protein
MLDGMRDYKKEKRFKPEVSMRNPYDGWNDLKIERDNVL